MSSSHSLPTVRQPVGIRGLSRRLLFRGVAASALGASLGVPQAGRAAARQSVQMPPIFPRAAWGAELPPKGPLEDESAGDVKFLLVHHTVDRNDYAEEEVPDLLRAIYGFHTSADKGWPDVAYNFLIDRFGRIWEGRSGSIERPVKASATGGSQGFAMLASMIGNYDVVDPPPAVEESMRHLLAWLATVYGIDTAAEVTFVSRGSNKHPAGVEVTTPTITGHNAMSSTACPGRFGDQMVLRLRQSVPAMVAAAGPPPADVVAPQAPTNPTPGTDAISPPAQAEAPAPTPAAPGPAPTSPPDAMQAAPTEGPSAVPSRRPIVASGQVGTAPADRTGLVATAAALLASVAAGAVGMSRLGRPGSGASAPPAWTHQPDDEDLRDL